MFPRAAHLEAYLIVTMTIAAVCPISVMAGGIALPDYPSAHVEKISGASHSGTTGCGHTITVEKSLTADADPHTVAKWYQSRVPGSRTIDLSRVTGDESDGASQMTELEVISADGSQTIVVSRMNFSSEKLREASKAIGLDRAQIGLESISPPFGSNYVALVSEVAAGGAAGKMARAQLEASCKR